MLNNLKTATNIAKEKTMHPQYSGILLKERIKHNAKTMEKFANIVQMNPRTFREKIKGNRHFTWEEMQKVKTALGEISSAEAGAYFFLSKDMETNLYHKLFKSLLGKNIAFSELAAELKISLDALFDKITGKSDFYWEEATTITSKYFPEYSMAELFERGVVE